MRLLHDLARTRAVFDEPALVSQAGLVPVMALAEQAGLSRLVAEHVRPRGKCGVNAAAKIGCVVAGMAAGADSIEDLDVLRHGAMGQVFAGVRAPSTLGSHLRVYSPGNAAQLDKVSREFLISLARRVPLLPGAQTLAFVDIDATLRRVYGHAKEGARFGHARIGGKDVLLRGLSVLVATVSTPLAAPVIAGTRLRGGNAASSRGAAWFAARAVRTARACGATGTIIVRMDSACYGAAVLHAIRRAGARFSVTVPLRANIRRVIAAVPDGAWTPVRYPRAIWDPQLGCWISDAEIAEVPYTAFAGNPRAPRGPGDPALPDRPVAARLIIRRVRDRGKDAASGQGELFPAWRYHAVFTDSPFVLVQAEAQHRDHAVIEQVHADQNDGPLAHLPSGSFAANAAWLACAAITASLLRAAGILASRAYGRARAATIRRDLVNVAARTARHGRGHLTLHLPARWHRRREWASLYTSTCGPPPPAA